MEKVQDQEQKIEVFENDIQLYLSMFCEENGIEDMKKESQSVWNAALMYIKRHVFNNPSILKSNKPLDGYINNNYNNKYNNLNNSNCNSYNIDMVSSVCDYYIYLCMMYDKEVSQIGFSNLTGINTDTIIDWGNNINKLSTSACDVYKKLSQFREESLSNKLVTGNKNPVGVIAVLNRQYGWASPYTSDSNKQRKIISAEEIRQKLSENNTQFIQDNSSIQMNE